MKICFLQNVISPHILPLAKSVANVAGYKQFCYCAVERITQQRRNLGWEDNIDAEWIVQYDKSKYADKNKFYSEVGVYDAGLLVSGVREWDVFEERLKCNLPSIYVSERWFKPKIGILRLFSPRFWRMAKKFAHMIIKNEHLFYFPIGIHAARDMARLCGLMNGDWKCLFCAPKLGFDKRPGGRIYLASKENSKKSKKYCLDKMRMWGYFVAPSDCAHKEVKKNTVKEVKEIRLLWVGRLIRLKRVDTIIRAVIGYVDLMKGDTSLPKITLDIYGAGPEEDNLKKYAKKYEDTIRFYPPVSIETVRRLMQNHDVYILASNGYEGWGAVVSEALEEGMKVLGTYEAGASATILSTNNLFHSGKWKDLLSLLFKDLAPSGIGLWSAENAAIYVKDFNGN